MDEILFKKTLKGDGDSFYKLIEPIKNTLYKIALMYMVNEDDALDCVQDGIIRAIKGLSTLKEPQYFNTWVTRIVINVCKDNLKKRNKVILVNIDECTTTTISGNYEKIDIEEDLYAALDKLSLQEKELIIRRYIEDMSLKDIASNMEVPIGTIKSRINRTLKKLRVHMRRN